MTLKETAHSRCWLFQKFHSNKLHDITGFFYGKPDHESQIYDSNTYVKEYTYLGIVGEKNEKSRYAIEQRNKYINSSLTYELPLVTRIDGLQGIKHLESQILWCDSQR